MSNKTYLAMVVLASLVVSFAVGAEPYPEGAKGFAGMVNGKVTGKATDQITLSVTRVDRVWKHSKAETPEALVGKEVTIKVSSDLYSKKPGYLDRVRRFFGLLKIGDSDTFDVKHAEGDVLLFLELTKAQMERVEQPPK